MSGISLAPSERIIVAADYTPKTSVQLFNLVPAMRDTGAVLKLNAVLRATDYDLIDRLQGSNGIKVFADLKLCDIPATMANDAGWLAAHKPYLVTVMCCAGIDGMKAVRDNLPPECGVLGVTVLTSLDHDGCAAVFNATVESAVLKFAGMAKEAGLDGLICSAQEVELLRTARYEGSLNTPGIRPKWSLVEADDQARVMTPAAAISAGADRLVIGRPITGYTNPREAIELTRLEIMEALSPACE